MIAELPSEQLDGNLHEYQILANDGLFIWQDVGVPEKSCDPGRWIEQRLSLQE